MGESTFSYTAYAGARSILSILPGLFLRGDIARVGLWSLGILSFCRVKYAIVINYCIFVKTSIISCLTWPNKSLQTTPAPVMGPAEQAPRQARACLNRGRSAELDYVFPVFMFP